MPHIKQKNSSEDPNKAYTIVLTPGYGGVGEPPLSEHPSVVEWPALFEVVDTEIPEGAQELNYTG